MSQFSEVYSVLLEGAEIYEPVLPFEKEDAIHLSVNPAGLPNDLLLWLRDSGAVISGSFATALAMHYQKGIVPFVPNDIDAFLVIFPDTDRSILERLPGIDDGLQFIGDYDIQLYTGERDMDRCPFGQIIYRRLIQIGQVTIPLQIIVFSTDDDSWLMHERVSESMDFTVTSNVLYYEKCGAPADDRLVFVIPYPADIDNMNLIIKDPTYGDDYGVTTKPHRVAKWHERGFAGEIPKSRICERGIDVDADRSKVGFGSIINMKDCRIDIAELPELCAGAFIKIIACQNVEIVLPDEELYVKIEASTCTVTGDASGELHLYGCQSRVHLNGPMKVFNYEDRSACENWISRLNETSIETDMVPLGREGNFQRYRAPYKSKEGYWIVENLPGDDQLEAYSKHHDEIYDQPIEIPCPYEETDAWYWKSPSYKAKTPFTALQIAYWGFAFCNYYEFNSMACHQMKRSLRLMDLFGTAPEGAILLDPSDDSRVMRETLEAIQQCDAMVAECPQATSWHLFAPTARLRTTVKNLFKCFDYVKRGCNDPSIPRPWEKYLICSPDDDSLPRYVAPQRYSVKPVSVLESLKKIFSCLCSLHPEEKPKTEAKEAKSGGERSEAEAEDIWGVGREPEDVWGEKPKEPEAEAEAEDIWDEQESESEDDE